LTDILFTSGNYEIYNIENDEFNLSEWKEARLKFRYENKKSEIDIKRKYIDEPLDKFLENSRNYFQKTLQEKSNT